MTDPSPEVEKGLQQNTQTSWDKRFSAVSSAESDLRYTIFLEHGHGMLTCEILITICILNCQTSHLKYFYQSILKDFC